MQVYCFQRIWKPATRGDGKPAYCPNSVDIQGKRVRQRLGPNSCVPSVPLYKIGYKAKRHFQVHPAPEAGEKLMIAGLLYRPGPMSAGRWEKVHSINPGTETNLYDAVFILLGLIPIRAGPLSLQALDLLP